MSLRPIDQRRYGPDDRVIDLVRRMAATRHSENITAFACDLTDPASGLLTNDLHPGGLW